MKLIVIIISALLLVAAISLLAAMPVYFLWNWLMPDIFGLKQITYYQAVGLLMLTGIFFKSSTSSSK